MTAPRHAWIDPTAKWLMGHHVGLLLWWERIDGEWRAWCVWAEQGAQAHGGKVRTRMEWLREDQVRLAIAAQPEMDLSGVRPVGEARG